MLKIKATFLCANSLRYNAAKTPKGTAKIKAPNVEIIDASKRFKIPNFPLSGAHSLEKTKLKKPILKMAGSPKTDM